MLSTFGFDIHKEIVHLLCLCLWAPDSLLVLFLDAISKISAKIPPVLNFSAKRGITPCRVSLDSGASGTKSVSNNTRHWSGKG